jgi:transmembrane sensor
MHQSEKYKFYAANDFANDEAFWLWVVEQDPEQARFWLNFIQENPGKKAEIEKARLLVLEFNRPEEDLPDKKVKNLWHRIENTRESLPQPDKTTLLIPPKRAPWFAIAAVISLLLISAALGWFLFFKPNPVTLATTYGQRQEFRLPDGSRVLLNANSQIKYTDNWGSANDREVWLTGEGFFWIQPKKNLQPFVLHAGSVEVKVLGTSFNVNNRRDEVKVLLSTGQISLGVAQAKTPPLLLQPGDLVTYQETEAKLYKTTADPESYLAWKKNLLSFKAESLENIFIYLKDNYNLQITAEDPAILQKKFTGTVPADDLTILFTGLQEGYNLKIIQSGNNIRIENK